MKNVIILAIAIITMAYQAARADQFVSADCETDPSGIAVYYAATDIDLVGLALRMHWDSSRITYSHIDDVLEDSYFGSYGPMDDTKDFDNDPNTDQFFFVGWVNWRPPPSWPGVYVTKLFNFVLAGDGSNGNVGNVGFSAVSTPPMHELFWTGC